MRELKQIGWTYGFYWQSFVNLIQWLKHACIQESDGQLSEHFNVHKRIWRMLRQHQIGMKRVTHHAHNTHFSEMLMNGYNLYLKEIKNMLGIDHDCIASFDETNVNFSPSATTTLDRRGSRTVAVKACKSSKRCIVMLGVTGDRKPFQPYIIFSGKYSLTGQINQWFQKMYNHARVVFQIKMSAVLNRRTSVEIRLMQKLL